MNVLWIVVDCLRYDAFSLNGYKRSTTETVDRRLDRDFIDFSDASTQSGYTLNVVSSMVTGTYPSTHGVIKLNDKLSNEIPLYNDMIDSSCLGPAEAIPGMNFITDEWGVNNAFDTVHNLEEAKSKGEAPLADGEAIRKKWEQVHSETEKFNNLLWFFDLHVPRRSATEFQGDNGERDRYDTELRYVSQELEKVFQSLEDSGEYDDTLIILTGDHGDIFDEYYKFPWTKYTGLAKNTPLVQKYFQEGGYIGHLDEVFVEELVHVPLYIKLPSSEMGGKTFDGQVELIDILPTILDLVDEEPPKTVEGDSLLPKIFEDETGKEYVWAEMGVYPASGLSRMARGKEYKYIKNIPPSIKDMTGFGSGVHTYLRNKYLRPAEVLLKRGSEEENIVQTNPDKAEEMRKIMGKWESNREIEHDSTISDTKKEELENLGYL